MSGLNDKLIARINEIIALRTQLDAKAKAAAEEAERNAALVKEIDRVDLPAMMLEAEMTEITTTDGVNVKLVKKVNAGISDARRFQAHAWLREKGFGGLIKTNVNVAFSPQEHEQAEKAAAELNSKYSGNVEINESVHPATLKAFVVEQMEEGKDVPADIFGIFVFEEVKIKAQAKSKTKK